MGMMFAGVWRRQVARAEKAQVASSAAEWAYEKNSVKDLLQEPSSSGPVGLRAGTTRTEGGPT